MKIFGIGTDIVNIDRIKQSLKKNGSQFKKRIFSKDEIKYCENKKNSLSGKRYLFSCVHVAKSPILESVLEKPPRAPYGTESHRECPLCLISFSFVSFSILWSMRLALRSLVGITSMAPAYA